MLLKVRLRFGESEEYNRFEQFLGLAFLHRPYHWSAEARAYSITLNTESTEDQRLLAWIYLALTRVHSWEFVGPNCIYAGHPFMVIVGSTTMRPQLECPQVECRYSHPLYNWTTFRPFAAAYGALPAELRNEIWREVIEKVALLPWKPGVREELPATITAPPSKKHKREFAEQTLGANYETLEVAIAASMFAPQLPKVVPVDMYNKAHTLAKNLQAGNALVTLMDRAHVSKAADALTEAAACSAGPGAFLILKIDGPEVLQDALDKTDHPLNKVAIEALRMYQARSAIKQTKDLGYAEVVRGRKAAIRSEPTSGSPAKQEAPISLVVAKSAPSPELAKVADGMFRFLTGVNFQDHERGEQREFLEHMTKLRDALVAAGIGRSE